MKTKITPTGCCPVFEPEMWDGNVLTWDKKRFIKGRVRTLWYMPLNFGSVIKRLMKATEQSGATVQDWLGLSEYRSKWNMDLYLAVDREVSGAKNVTLSGRYLCKVYEGPYKDTQKWMEDFNRYAEYEGYTVTKTYLWYTTCPKCAKVYGKNYAVVVAELVASAI